MYRLSTLISKVVYRLNAPILNVIRRRRKLSYLLAIHKLLSTANKNDPSYLQCVGWFNSISAGKPVDMEGKPLPWLTYAAIAFLENRIRKEMAIFEWGSGNSTIWWASRVQRIVSCEHNKSWYEGLAPRLPPNVEYVYFDLVPGGDYSKAIQRYHEEFEIIVIDGRDRVNCAQHSLGALKPDGIIIWDNSDREKYRPGYEYLIGKGFKRLDFSGMGPAIASGWCTSVFYRPGNCLGI